MRALFTLVFCNLLLIAQAQTGWTQENVSIPGDITPGGKIRWLNPSTGIVAGLNECYSTTDSGKTWQQFAYSDLANVALLSGQHYVVAQDTAIYVTYDGVDYNETFTPNFDALFLAMYFIDENNGWVTSTDGYMYGTTDGGVNWNFVSGTGYKKGAFNTLRFTSVSNGVAGTNMGAVLYSRDSGSTWTAATTPASSIDSTYIITSLKYRDSLNVFATAKSSSGYSSIIHSADGGMTWATVHNEIGEVLQDMDFMNADTAFAVGYLLSPRATFDNTALIYQSNDGGMTWTQLTFNNICYLSCVDFLNPTWGWITGSCSYKYDITTLSGIAQSSIDQPSITLSPDPALSKLSVSTGFTPGGILHYQVMDIYGRTVIQEKITGNEFSADVSSLAPGCYFLRVENDQEQVTRTFSKL